MKIKSLLPIILVVNVACNLNEDANNIKVQEILRDAEEFEKLLREFSEEEKIDLNYAVSSISLYELWNNENWTYCLYTGLEMLCGQSSILKNKYSTVLYAIRDGVRAKYLPDFGGDRNFKISNDFFNKIDCDQETLDVIIKFAIFIYLGYIKSTNYPNRIDLTSNEKRADNVYVNLLWIDFDQKEITNFLSLETGKHQRLPYNIIYENKKFTDVIMGWNAHGIIPNVWVTNKFLQGNKNNLASINANFIEINEQSLLFFGKNAVFETRAKFYNIIDALKLEILLQNISEKECSSITVFADWTIIPCKLDKKIINYFS